VAQKQEFPKYLYHPTLAPSGKVFNSAEETKGLRESWVDTPAKFPTPSTFRVKARLFWETWDFAFKALAATLIIIAAAIGVYKAVKAPAPTLTISQTLTNHLEGLPPAARELLLVINKGREGWLAGIAREKRNAAAALLAHQPALATEISGEELKEYSLETGHTADPLAYAVRLTAEGNALHEEMRKVLMELAAGNGAMVDRWIMLVREDPKLPLASK
jgi:hypothetical protein